MNALHDEQAPGTTYECVGPHSYYLADLVDYFYRLMRYENTYRIPITPFFQ